MENEVLLGRTSVVDRTSEVMVGRSLRVKFIRVRARNIVKLKPPWASG